MSTRALLRLARNLHATRNLEEVMERVNEAVSETTRYQHAWLSFVTRGAQGVEIVGYATSERQMLHECRVDLDIANDRFLMRTFGSSEPYVIEDAREDPEANHGLVAARGIQTCIVVPFLLIGDRIGAFQIATFAEQGIMPPTPAEMEMAIQIGSLVSVVVDRVEAERAQRELLETAHAEQRLEAIGQLTGEIAHDFSNLLTCINGNAELALRQIRPHVAESMLQEILSASGRAKGLIRQLLAFSSGQVCVRDLVHVDEFLRSLADTLAPRLPEKCQIVLELDGPSFTEMDSIQLGQIVTNLVLNARDAMPSGGLITLGLTSETIEQGDSRLPADQEHGDYLHLFVRDAGVGMGADLRDQAFEPFFTSKERGNGAGLGLSVVAKALHQNQGFALLESEAGFGTTVHAYLPRCEAPARSCESHELEFAGGSEHILIVDDERALRVVLTRALSDVGYHVSQASNGNEALQKIASSPDIALIVSDIVMPGMGGAELLGALTEAASKLPVLLTSGYTSASQPVLHSHILPKPFEIDVLRSRVRALLDQSRTTE